MKVALLISGYLRTLKMNVENIQKFIINEFENVDVYMHVTTGEIDSDKYFNPNELYESIKFINENLSPKVLLCEENCQLSTDKKKNDLLNLWYKYYKLNSLKSIEEVSTSNYDLVIKLRPDVNFNNLSFNTISLLNDTICIPISSKIDKGKLTNIDDSFICDIFAYGSSNAMDKYFQIYNELPLLIKKHGSVSETVLFHYLNDFNIKYELYDIDYSVILSICNTFAICGDSGSGKSTLGELLKQHFSNSVLLECDRYHKWERNDENWSKFTHLNPRANFLTKMKEDIFNLKIGNSIYQVDYDHNNGKFTEKEKIESTDNIVVCGLHSLYGSTDSVYDLKIFMDTDESLKYEWKFERDHKKRGYSREQVAKQINDRKIDYKKYIEPQKYKSDIIVNFFQSIDSINDVSLKVSISKKHNILHILNAFSAHNIPFEISSNKNFNEILFHSYKKCELWNFSSSPNHFYDYVLYMILHIKNNH